jgi:hypothetical protein
MWRSSTTKGLNIVSILFLYANVLEVAYLHMKFKWEVEFDCVFFHCRLETACQSSGEELEVAEDTFQ